MWQIEREGKEAKATVREGERSEGSGWGEERREEKRNGIKKERRKETRNQRREAKRSGEERRRVRRALFVEGVFLNNLEQRRKNRVYTKHCVLLKKQKYDNKSIGQNY